LGGRVGGIAGFYSRYKFNTLRFEFRSKLPTTTSGTYVVGVVDDVNSNTISSGVAQVLDLRTSMEKHLFQDITLRWSPIDRSKWYYTNSGSDQREVIPCSIFVTTEDTLPTSGTPLMSFDLHYSITFEGASNTAIGLRKTSQESDYAILPPTPSGAPAPPLQNSRRR
jgi:hypothetical protein